MIAKPRSMSPLALSTRSVRVTTALAASSDAAYVCCVTNLTVVNLEKGV